MGKFKLNIQLFAGVTTPTTQVLYSNAVLAKLTELNAAGIKSIAERKTEEGGEKAVFYRVKESVAVDGVASMYSANGANAGDMESFDATISQVSSQQKVKKEDMMKTKLDLKAPFVNSMANAVLNKEDSKILTAIKAKEANLAKVGASGAEIDTLPQIRALIMAVRSAHAKAQLTPDGKKGVILAMGLPAYTKLAASDIFINGDYKDAFGGGTGDLPLSFYGAEIRITSQVPAATTATDENAYVIPSNTFGYAEWEGSEEVTAEYHPTDAQRWHLQVVKSVGVTVIEPESISQFVFKKVSA